jgi:hypothetical protein
MIGCYFDLDIILGVNAQGKIYVLDSIPGDFWGPAAISPDSKIGVYGNRLNSLRFHRDYTYEIVPSDNPDICIEYSDFSSLNNKLYVRNSPINPRIIGEYTLLPDGRTTATGAMVDISPSSGNEDFKISPDGKTGISLSSGTYIITVLNIFPNGGFSIKEQFNLIYNGYSLGTLNDIAFTPDSKYAIISHLGSYNIVSFRINNDSSLTLVDGLDLPEYPGEVMNITPDGKFVITRDISYGGTTFFCSACS